MSQAFKVLLIAGLLSGVAAAQAGEAARTPNASPDGLSENGLSVNGIRKNGMSLNRIAFNGNEAGTRLSGIPLDRVGIR